jgi:hypothetical protein
MKNSTMRATNTPLTMSRTTVKDVVGPILAQCHAAQAELKHRGEFKADAYEATERLKSFCLGLMAAESDHTEPGSPQLRAVR